MPVFKKTNEPEKPDPVFEYLERTSPRGMKLQRLETLLKQMNLQTAGALEHSQQPPEKRKKS